MIEVTALETIEELDQDQDGFLNLDEYLGEMKHLEIPDNDVSSDDDVIIPMTDDDYDDDDNTVNTREYNIEWLQAEKDAFNSVRDTNGDGYVYKMSTKNYSLERSRNVWKF